MFDTLPQELKQKVDSLRGGSLASGHFRDKKVSRKSFYNFKPWGSEEVIYKVGDVQVKIIRINDGEELSLQFHKYKSEVICLLGGDAKFVLSDIYFAFEPHKFIHIPPNVVHRFIGIRKAEILEVSIGTDRDIVRLQDKYGRLKGVENGKED